MVQLAKHFGFGIVALLCLFALHADISRSRPGGLAGLLFVNIPLYLLPTVIASYRIHRNTAVVAVLNPQAGPAVRFVRVGTIDNPDLCPPDIHIYTSSKLPWVTLPTGY
jgi:hypothetical protein